MSNIASVTICEIFIAQKSCIFDIAYWMYNWTGSYPSQNKIAILLQQKWHCILSKTSINLESFWANEKNQFWFWKVLEQIRNNLFSSHGLNEFGLFWQKWPIELHSCGHLLWYYLCCHHPFESKKEIWVRRNTVLIDSICNAFNFDPNSYYNKIYEAIPICSMTNVKVITDPMSSNAAACFGLLEAADGVKIVLEWTLDRIHSMH